MLNLIPKSVHFLDYVNFGHCFIFPLVNQVNVSKFVQLSIRYMPVNIELAKFA